MYYRSCWFWIKVREAAISQWDDRVAGKQYANIVGLKENKGGASGSEWGNVTTTNIRSYMLDDTCL